MPLFNYLPVEDYVDFSIMYTIMISKVIFLGSCLLLTWILLDSTQVQTSGWWFPVLTIFFFVKLSIRMCKINLHFFMVPKLIFRHHHIPTFLVVEFSLIIQ